MERGLLKKGLIFCPTPITMEKEIFYQEINSFKRNLSLKVYFEGINKQYKSVEIVKTTTLQKILKRDKKLQFEPPTMHCIETFVSAINDEIENSRKAMVKDNLSTGERDALKRLANNQDIVIKKADKGEQR